jgi:hypothetical protein
LITQPQVRRKELRDTHAAERIALFPYGTLQS